MKIRARRRFRAVHAVAPLDHVEVQLEDTRLFQLRLEPASDDELAEFTQWVPRRRKIQILRELLSDCAAASQQPPARPVGLQRFLQLLEVDALMLPERIVF